MPNIPEPKDAGDSVPFADGGKDLGEALSKFDFSQIDSVSYTTPGSQGVEHSDAHAALASMSSDDALDYAISHIGGADHLDAGRVGDVGHDDAGHVDIGHFDMPDASHGS